MPNPSSAYSPPSSSSGLPAPGSTAAPTVPRAAVSAPAAPASNLGWMQPGAAPGGASPTAGKLDDVTPDFVTPDGVESVVGESLGVKQDSAASVAVKPDGAASVAYERRPDLRHRQAAWLPAARHYAGWRRPAQRPASHRRVGRRHASRLLAHLKGVVCPHRPAAQLRAARLPVGRHRAPSAKLPLARRLHPDRLHAARLHHGRLHAAWLHPRLLQRSNQRQVDRHPAAQRRPRRRRHRQCRSGCHRPSPSAAGSGGGKVSNVVAVRRRNVGRLWRGHRVRLRGCKRTRGERRGCHTLGNVQY